MMKTLRYLLICFVVLAITVPLALIVILETGMADAQLKELAIRQIDQTTGGRAEIGTFHFRLRDLRLVMADFTLHGREAAGSRPLFHADKVLVRAHFISFWGKRVALDEVVVNNPVTVLHVNADGENNLPIPPHRTTSPWREKLFDLRIGHLSLENGEILYNNEQIPVNAIADEFQFSMVYQAADGGRDVYAADLAAENAQVALQKDAPFHGNIKTHVTLSREGISIDQLIANVGQSQLQIRADLARFDEPEWDFHARVRLDLSDAAHVFRQPNMPSGTVEMTGEGKYGASLLSWNGHYQARGITFRNQWFHASNIASWGRLDADREGLQLGEFGASALGGMLTGRLKLTFDGWRFWTATQIQGINLAAAMDAVNNRSLPIDPLHWNGSISATSVNEWQGAFRHFRTRGDSTWTTPSILRHEEFPASALIHFDYVNDKRTMTLTNSKIWTPDSVVLFDGTLAKGYSKLQLDVTAGNLLEWDDFINALRGPKEPDTAIGGTAHWKGQILGLIGGPEITGHLDLGKATYGHLYWDELCGDLMYSPDEFHFENVHAVRGHTGAEMNLALDFDGKWGFVDESPWSLDVNLQDTPVEGLQELFGTSYPLAARVFGHFHGGGTRAKPHLDGKFQADHLVAEGVHFDRFSGHLDLEPAKLCVNEARVDADTGHISGHVCYSFDEKATDFSIRGQRLALARLLPERASQWAIRGELEFEAQGHGPIFSPEGNATVNIRGLNIEGENEGDLNARVTADGQVLHALIESTVRGEVSGDLEIAFHDDYKISGRADVMQADLDPLIETALHLNAITGHSRVDGSFVVSGALRRPDSIRVDATIPHLSLEYESVNLQNAAPIQISYSGQTVRIEQAKLRGPNSDFQIGGDVNLKARSINIQMEGAVNLHLLEAFMPQLDARGATQAKATITGTFDKPEVTGQIKVIDASAQYGDFPVGLNHMNGTLVFSRQQLVFNGVTAQSGGGNLEMSGFVAYRANPISFQIAMTATNVRIRYPAGLSWRGSATLKLAGTSNGAVLSGNVTADRLLLTTDTGLAGLMVAGASTSVSIGSTPSSSRFLRNLEFDITAQTSPGARMEWTGGQIDVEGSQRLRGTWDHPVLLGNVHVLAGTVNFQGTKYEISRGDLNFANPFLLNPVLNVEATTTVQQYVITLDFSGPMNHLTVAYRADPPLPSSDIVALLAGGSTTQSTALRSTNGQAQNLGAAALVSNAISNQFGGRIQRLFGISQFRVEPFLASTATEQNTAARVTVQQQVTHNLTVTYSSNATANQQQVVQIEYAVNPRVSIVGLRDINGIYSVSVKFKKRFK